jgi:hypothetical protein
MPASASAAVPALLMTSTVRAGLGFAAHGPAGAVVSSQTLLLARGALNAMLTTQIKLTTAVVLLAGLAVPGAGFIGNRTAAEEPVATAEAQDRPRPDDQRREEPRRGDSRPADGRREEPRQREFTEVSGLVKSLDAAVGTITLTQGRDPNSDRTLNLTKNVEVTIDGKPDKLAEIAERMPVTVRVSNSTGDVIVIRAEGMAFRSLVRSVEPATNKISVGMDRRDATFTVAKDAEIQVDGRPGKLADFQAGTVVTLKLSAKGVEIVSLVTGQSAEGRRGEARSERAGRKPAVVGTLAKVDAERRSVTVTVLTVVPGGEDAQAELTFEVARDAGVTIDGRAKSLADLVAGKPVTLEIADDHKTVSAVRMAVAPSRPQER